MKRVREVIHAVNPASTAAGQSDKSRILVKKLKVKITQNTQNTQNFQNTQNHQNPLNSQNAQNPKIHQNSQKPQNLQTTTPQKPLKIQKSLKTLKPSKTLKRIQNPNKSSKSSPSTPNQRFINAGDFKIQKCIGEGAFGKVYTVSTTIPTFSSSNSKVPSIFAMKSVQKSKILSAPHHIKNHTQEFEIMKQVRHPCIIGLKFAFQTRKTIKFVMEFGQGGDLFSLLSRHGCLSELQAKFYIGQLALVLEYLHKNSIMYRDLKTENILLSKSGDVKLADFGLSRKLKSGEKAYSFSGTPEYMAPEMLNSKKRNVSGYGKYVDFWSLGVLFFQLLHNNTPFQENGLNGKEQVKCDDQNDNQNNNQNEQKVQNFQNSKPVDNLKNPKNLNNPKNGNFMATSLDNSDSGQSGHSTGSVNTTGTTGFHEKPQDRLFKVIKQANAIPKFEKSDLSDKVQNLICGLLNFSYRGRIKSSNQIFNHEFFSDVVCRHDYINGKIKPPIVPSVDDSKDVSCFDEEYVIRKISDSASMTQADDSQCEVAKLARTDSHSSFAYTNAYGYPVAQKPAYNFPDFSDLSDFKALSGFIDLSTKDDLNKGVSTSEVSTDLSGSNLCSINFSKNSKIQNHVLSSFTSQLSNQSVESAYELSLEDGFFQEVKKTKKIATFEHSSYDQNIGILPYASADLSGWSSFLESSIQTKNAKEADVFSCFHYDYTVGGVRCTYEL